VEKFVNALNACKQEGIRNILALRGDPPAGKKWEAVRDGFAHGSDLVRFIRQTHGDYFCVCVAGYPEGHPDARSYEEELYWLKQKVDAGADLVISQLFYDANCFLKWVADCRAIGIKVGQRCGVVAF
jgi:methylenetetrahydrofolate reductase (NADPH)